MILDIRTNSNLRLLEGEPHLLAEAKVNNFIPVHIFRNGRYNINSINTFGRNEGDLFYYKPISITSLDYTYRMIYSSTYRNLFKALRGESPTIRFDFRTGEESRSIVVSKGYISNEDGHILLLLALRNKEEVISKYMGSNAQSEANPEDLVLFITHEFVSSETYKNVFRRIKRDYIDLTIVNQIDLIHTTSSKILKEVYSNSLSLTPKDPTNFKKAISNLSLTNLKRFLEGDYSFVEEVQNTFPAEEIQRRLGTLNETLETVERQTTWHDSADETQEELLRNSEGGAEIDNSLVDSATEAENFWRDFDSANSEEIRNVDSNAVVEMPESPFDELEGEALDEFINSLTEYLENEDNN